MSSYANSGMPDCTTENIDFINAVEDAFIDVFSNPPIDDGVLDKLSAAGDIYGEYCYLWPGIVQLFTPSAQRIISFVMRVPGFTKLEDTDQIIILRGCVMDSLMFRMGSRFNRTTKTLPVRNNKHVYRFQAQNLCEGAMWPYLRPLFDTAENISNLHLSVTEAALTLAILAIETDRLGLKDVDSVYALQQKLVNACQHHVRVHNPEDKTKWQRILMQVSTIRAVTEENAYWIIFRLSYPSVNILSVQMLEDAY